MDALHDRRTDSYSILLTLEVGAYLDMVKSALAARGGIAGQRDILPTTTAKRIRSRMIADIKKGAVLPAVVIGVVGDQELLQWLPNADSTSDLIGRLDKYDLSIIDGMQRTGSFAEAANEESAVGKMRMRVEFWIARSVSSLVYRMLVLNTGQVPWTLARQLSVVYSQLLSEIKTAVPDLGRLFSPDDSGRRATGGEFSSESVVEMFLAFSLRKSNIDTKEALSEEFSRLDLVENVENDAFQKQFYRALDILVRLDIVFSLYEGSGSFRMKRGRDIFASSPARIGFMVAAALYIIGRPGTERSESEREGRLQAIVGQSKALCDRLNEMQTDALGDFLQLDVLSEILDRRVGQVGRYERGVFQEAFEVLIKEGFEVRNMEMCWRAG